VLLTYVYYPYRRRSGDVLAIGWLAYPISRFLIEFLRTDEPAIWRTPFTAAQLVSLGLFASAVAFAFWLRKQPPGLQPLLQTTGQASGYRPKATAKTVDFQSASVARSP
jgi:phosphatidylglycerol:prolipoprotein diacylglycerol transferase